MKIVEQETLGRGEAFLRWKISGAGDTGEGGAFLRWKMSGAGDTGEGGGELC